MLRHLTFRRNYFRASSLFIYYENHNQSTVIKKKRLEIHWSMLNAHWGNSGKPFFLYGVYTRPRRKSLVMDVRYAVLIRFPIIAQRSKGAHYFHRVVGLVVISVYVSGSTHTTL